MDQKMQSPEALYNKFLPLINRPDESRNGSQREISQLTLSLSPLLSDLINNFRKIKEASEKISEALPETNHVINNTASLPSLPLSMESCQNMKSLVHNAFEVLETGSHIKDSNLQLLENLEEACKHKEQLLIHAQEREYMLRDRLQTIDTLLDDFKSIYSSKVLHKSTYSRSASKISDSSIISIRSENIQASSSVLEKAQTLDPDNLDNSF